MCLVLMFSLPTANWLRLIVWLLIGLVIYFSYSRHHSFMKKYLAHEIAAHGVSPAGSLATDIESDPKEGPDTKRK